MHALAAAQLVFDRLNDTDSIRLADREGDKKAQKILNELENIDDECEEKSIDFIKTSDEGIDKEYDLAELPALAFYRHKFRTIYTGDLMKEDEILDWVLDLYESNPDVIESVDRKTLQVLINDVEHLAVFFCKFVAHVMGKESAGLRCMHFFLIFVSKLNAMFR